MSIADVAHRTRIPARVIEALEKDDYGSFPSPTYAKSFLAQYADFVGIDSSRWMDYFEPVAFTGTDDVLAIVDAPDSSHHHHHYHDPKAAEPRLAGSGRGMGSTLMLILITGGLIYACMKAWPELEKRFAGSDPGTPPPPPPKFIDEHAPKSLPTEAPAKQQAPNPTVIVSKPATRGADEPIPRAIIVD
ncbi:helix-turn-helix transcriptional regulator [Luteolibacter sp. LG18]|uniref:helix-turn-helix domain-containing protein n=1 Tax=Luteolibacter sp. LG18 TaxID=2819286 RepID=UPI002B2F4EEC|nr:hypothetical protein llg_04810 [Luteolibacter sp. LG18]